MILTVSLNPAVDVDYLVERLHWEDRNPVLEERRAPGGKGLNVSRVVQELGGRTLAITTVGGRTGMELRQLLKTAEIPARFVTIAGNTRTNLAITERDGQSVRLNPKGPKVSARELHSLFQTVERALPGAAVLVLSGSLPAGMPLATYARLIRLARSYGVPCALDADGPALQKGVLAQPYLVKPNRFEAERLLGRKLLNERALVRAAKEMLEKFGVQMVLLTLGKDGAVLATREPVARISFRRPPRADGLQRIHLREWGGCRPCHLTRRLCATGSHNLCLYASSPPVRVVSAIGAGDSALAAFLLRLIRHRATLGERSCSTDMFADALRWAMAAGAACAITPGTELCHRDDVERLVKRVAVRRLKS